MRGFIHSDLEFSRFMYAKLTPSIGVDVPLETDALLFIAEFFLSSWNLLGFFLGEASSSGGNRSKAISSFAAESRTPVLVAHEDKWLPAEGAVVSIVVGGVCQGVDKVLDKVFLEVDT